jgi:guanylate kinase
MKNLIALFGESGSGKDYVAQKAEEEFNYYKIIRTTSRSPRGKESERSPYYFKDKFLLQQDITEYIEDYLEVGEFNGFIYTTHKNELKSNINIGCYDVGAIEQLLESKDINVIPIYTWASAKLRIMRQLNREPDPNIDEICRRYFDDKKQYANVSFDYFRIDNIISIEDTLNSLKIIIDKNIK